ncbi:MAG: DUF2267 domain-containing protein [Nitrospirota bacterium]
MKYDEFVERVQQTAELHSLEDATKVVEAVLKTLGERLTRGEREDLASQLPKELKDYLYKHRTPERSRLEYELFSLEEFYNRVGARTKVRYKQAVKLSQVVGEVLREAVSPRELQDILSDLPEEFDELFGKKPESPLSPSATA